MTMRVEVEDAAERLEELVEELESGRAAAVVLTRNGEPAALLLPIAARTPI